MQQGGLATTRVNHMGVSHSGLAIYIFKNILKAKKKEFMKNQIFHHAKILIFQKSSKKNQNTSRYYNSITHLKFQHKPKYIIFQTRILI